MSTAPTIIERLQADSLLAGSNILTQVQKLQSGLNYKTDDKFVAFDEHFLYLQEQIDSIPRLKLSDVVTKTNAMQYENELFSGLEEILDAVEKWTVKTARFQGDLLTAKGEVEELRAAFESWYLLAAQEVLASTGGKLPATSLRQLALSEFSRLLDRSHFSIEALIEAVKIELKRLGSKARMAQQKFEMGREQVNSVWVSRLPELIGNSTAAPSMGVVNRDGDDEEEEEETIPAYESHAINSIPVPALNAEPVVTKGFFKTGDAQPVKIISTEASEPIPTFVARYTSREPVTISGPESMELGALEASQVVIAKQEKPEPAVTAATAIISEIEDIEDIEEPVVTAPVVEKAAEKATEPSAPILGSEFDDEEPPPLKSAPVKSAPAHAPVPVVEAEPKPTTPPPTPTARKRLNLTEGMEQPAAKNVEKVDKPAKAHAAIPQFDFEDDELA